MEDKISQIKNIITEKCQSENIISPGFFKLREPIGDMTHGITIGVPLSKFVIQEVELAGKPTHSYFHHYRTANFYLDRTMLEIGLILEKNGFQYLPIGASQSIPTEADPKGFHGRYSHKEGACLSGLGYMGANGLFLHKEFGSRLRLGTILTNAKLIEKNPPPPENTSCEGCFVCVKSCPSGALKGNIYKVGDEEWTLVDPLICSQHMKKAYQKIGRGAVCGICIAVCPHSK